jgi:competence protein ComEC
MAKNKQNRISYFSIVIIILLSLAYKYLYPEGIPGSGQTTGIHLEKGTATVHFIDVGQGDSIYIKTSTHDILIDAGERGDIVTKYLKEQQVDDLELVISTHPHSDHIGGLIDVLENIPVEEVIDPGVVHTSKTFEDYLTLIDEKGIRFTEGRAGMRRTIEDGTILEILSPAAPDSDDLNNASIVAKFTYGTVSFLFTGDAEKSTEKEILSAGSNLKSTVLKAGHHGSSTSTSDDFLEAVSPKAAVIMCGTGNSYGHPHEEILEKLESADIDIYRTDLLGTIVIETDGKNYRVSSDKGE